MAYPEYQEQFARNRNLLQSEWAKCLPSDPSPLVLDELDNCKICLPWQRRYSSLFADYTFPDSREVQFSLYSWLSTHREIIHEPIRIIPPKYLDKFVRPRSEQIRDMLTYYDPKKLPA